MSAVATRTYYERTQFLYNLLWSKRALSYWLWGQGVRTVAQAIENQYQFVRATLHVSDDDHVLDLGCGTGGSAIRLAQLTGCQVTGLTLSEKQIVQANRMAATAGVAHLVTFRRIDFEQPLPFQEKSFSKAYSVEALCYATDKAAALKEVFRVIQPGGEILILDGFLRRPITDADLIRSYTLCLTGWRVPSLSTQEQFQDYLESAGFSAIQWHNKSTDVLPSSTRIRRLGLLLWPITRLLSWTRLIPISLHENTVTMIEQHRALREYAMYLAVVGKKVK